MCLSLLVKDNNSSSVIFLLAGRGVGDCRETEVVRLVFSVERVETEVTIIGRVGEQCAITGLGVGRLICWEEALNGNWAWWLGLFGPHKDQERICIGLTVWDVHSSGPNGGVGSRIVQGGWMRGLETDVEWKVQSLVMC